MRNEPIYRRRRLAALAILVVLVVLVVWAVSAIAGRGDPSPQARPSSTEAGEPVEGGASDVTPSGDTASGSPSAGGQGSPTSTGDTPACAADALSVTIATPSTTVSVGSTVKFAVSITSASEQACLVDGSDASRVVTITSGKERIWSSADCAKAEPRSLLMAKGDTDAKTVSWKTVRSEPGCDEDQPDLRPGTYKAQVTLGDVSSETLVLVLE